LINPWRGEDLVEKGLRKGGIPNEGREQWGPRARGKSAMWVRGIEVERVAESLGQKAVEEKGKIATKKKN